VILGLQRAKLERISCRRPTNKIRRPTTILFKSAERLPVLLRSRELIVRDKPSQWNRFMSNSIWRKFKLYHYNPLSR
jgi:hypothetical protein